MTRIRMFNNALYALAVLGALTFGAAQAFASPAPQQSARACWEDLCDNACGGPGTWFCEGGITCICI